MKTKTQSGFTIIELMIVIVIIGILGALAIPAYISYTTKSQVTDGIAIIGNLKTRIAEFYNATETFPADRGVLGLGVAADTQGEYVASVDVENGQIIINYGNGANPDISAVGANALTFRPYTDNDGNITWICGTKAAPAALTAGGVWVAATTVPADYLPIVCRV